MSGFKDEKALWQYQRRRLRGLWQRYELITPSGHPDLKGSWRNEIIYLENKVGDARKEALEQSQVGYINWLQQCGQNVYICFGHRMSDTVAFYRLGRNPNILHEMSPPNFWSPTPIRR